MEYIKEYRKFVNSYYFNEAIRITIGVTFPAIIFSYFGKLETGLILSIGAMAVSASDIPGPIHQRRNGMLATAGLIFIVSVVTGFINHHPLLLGCGIAFFCFALSFIGAYGARVNSIGFAGMLIMILTLDMRDEGIDVLVHGVYLLAGGLWYMMLSLALFGVRPYKIIQQALGDSIISIADYFGTRALFYEKGADYDKIFKMLMEQQQQIQDKQTLLREMLFKSRNIVKESTVTGRTLLIIFVESIDLFEKSSATFYNYDSMHKRFDESGILKSFQRMIYVIVDELHQIGLAVQSGRPPRASRKLNNELKILQTQYEDFVKKYRTPETFDALANMRKLMQSVEEITLRIYTLHHYSRYDRKKVKAYKLSGNYEHFVTKTDLDIEILKENFSLKSNSFRHALRVTLACVLGFIVAHLLQLQFSYWVLLTIIVILKPTYSVSRQRNYHRLIGTFVGALGGLGLLFLLPTQNGKFIAMIILMIITYSFMRTKYLVSVIFMTAFIMIFFYLLNSHTFYEIFKSRLIDTSVGSIIAFIAAYILVPSWEKTQINTYITNALKASKHYFNTVATTFATGELSDLDYKLSRKEAFIEQANLSGGFTRMMNEPKNKQGDIKKIHQMVVLIYTLNSHIVSLAGFSRNFSNKYGAEDFHAIREDIAEEMEEALLLLAHRDVPETIHHAPSELKEELDELVSKRRRELQQGLVDTETRSVLVEFKPVVDQFLFISRIAGDIKRLAKDF
ncbi:FUSC family membrane protein [Niabella insulamsoli]|uniref:FUSC family membrane protein n=1 Tax=Niabella insulamsoli TaxID=3144874 RepID=UPI0031FDBCA8